MFERSIEDVPLRTVGVIALGVVAGGATALVTDGVLPPAAVFAGVFVVLLIAERFDR